ncbi:betaine-aldehyde dehydrogenase [Acuticoccus sp. M5D2P5]|uniref:betaine-aldehyde dehydrogenase n=1 Tax=Acuticoccus kalidii TaxID=2910977 RepID=UPI001F1B6EF0|nr:betaine-aldehyde dehydrogenase [Acuticoccus kalidii]MCF3936117.1 betaine-aldehyde dehydrogenase [Acuticoccus kalidii]
MAQPDASHYVAGAPLEDNGGTPFESYDPATGEPIARLRAATKAVIDAAVRSADGAWRDWAARPGVERGRVLLRAAALLRERNRELSVLETRDTGKALQETLVADAASAADALEWFGGIAASIGGQMIPLGADFAYTRREPLGVCVGIGAWNYPIQIAAWKAAPALACGNAMIFKPSEVTPLSALKLAEILTEAGLPAGLFNVVQGASAVGSNLTANPFVAKVSMTGSVPTGRKVYTAAAEGLKPATLELGGKSPLIVFEDADLDDAVSGAMLGNFYSTGQVCTNGTRVFVHASLRDAFIERLVARTERIRIGDPLDEATQMGPLVSHTQREKVLSYIEAGREEGARLLTGGGIPEVAGFPNGAWIEPTIFADVTDTMTIAREEIFGPVLSLLTFEDEAEVIARANGTGFGLAAGLFTKDLARAHRVAAALDAGTLWINGYNLTPVEIPFGGVKASGLGRENGWAAIDHYSQVKSVHVTTGSVDCPY